jgi:hypothetical protein
MSMKHKNPNLPKLSDSDSVLKKAGEVSELLRYYADLLDDPNTTALEICAIHEFDFNTLLLDIYKCLLTDDPETHLLLQSIEPELFLPKL